VSVRAEVRRQLAESRAVVASSGQRYLPAERSWVKAKNRGYWRYEMEREGAFNSRVQRQFV
jgi:hypothetical protein